MVYTNAHGLHCTLIAKLSGTQLGMQMFCLHLICPMYMVELLGLQMCIGTY
jgi:hypothetical protein